MPSREPFEGPKFPDGLANLLASVIANWIVLEICHLVDDSSMAQSETVESGTLALRTGGTAIPVSFHKSI